MDTKLTLKLNSSVIKRAKKYASNKKISLSGLIENYLNSLTKEQNDEFKISPFVESISTGNSIPVNADWKELRKDYISHLDKKHQ